MKLIIGLGNPGKKYEKTRHNIGKWVIDQFKNFQFFRQRRTRLWWAIFRPKADQPLAGNFQLIKSPVFMNQSGEFMRKLVEQYKLPLDHLLIIHDDLDIPLGEFRLQKGREAAGHKGVESVIEALGSKDFWRLRIGIGQPEISSKFPPSPRLRRAGEVQSSKLTERYVLEKFKDDELQKIEALIPGVIEAIKRWLITNNK